MKVQKGFTLIELMVVIVIIGILSALAIPKMFGVSAKAKAAEAPGVIANWETLQSAYAQETGTVGAEAAVGFQNPTATSMWFMYVQAGATGDASASLTASIQAGMTFGTCDGTDSWSSTFTAARDSVARAEAGDCPAVYTPNFN